MEDGPQIDIHALYEWADKNKTIYENRVFDSHGVADPSVEIQFGLKHQKDTEAVNDNGKDKCCLTT